MGYATESTNVMYCWLDTMPYLIWSVPFNALSWAPVQNVDSGLHCLPPEPARDRHRLEHAPSHAHDGLVSPFDNSVLLWRVWCDQMPLDALLGAVVDEGSRRELTAVICS
jgi:hypothetical protein